MITPKGQRIIDLVNQRRYWEALGVTVNSTPNELNVAHLRLLNEFRDYPEIQRSLNIAKVKLRNLVTVKTDIHEPEESEEIQDTTDIEEEEIPDLLDERICDICGSDGPTKYVELHQNIGGIFTRVHKSVKGELCKSCINKYFWRFTLITLVVGWWGRISLFVTPFFILNNIRYYISSLWYFRKNRAQKSFPSENIRKARLRTIKDKMASINFLEILQNFGLDLCLNIRKLPAILIRHKPALLMICSVLVIGGIIGLVITKVMNHENDEPIQNLTEKNTQQSLPATSQKVPINPFKYDSKDKAIDDTHEDANERENTYTEKPSLEKPVLVKEIIGKDNIPMVLIPAGEFQMGGFSYENERPIHTVYLDAFYIDANEVTNAQYKMFLDATGYKVPIYWWDDPRFNSPGQPVVGVSWDDAVAYCEWVSKRLPTEAEWEKASKGGLANKLYPWGDNLSHDYANYSGTGGKDRWEHTSPVGSFRPNSYGLYDMAGNAWEWCSDWYDKNYYVNSPKMNPTGPISGDTRIIRGGAWSYFQDSANRYCHGPSNVYYDVGFRCCKSLDK